MSTRVQVASTTGLVKRLFRICFALLCLSLQIINRFEFKAWTEMLYAWWLIRSIVLADWDACASLKVCRSAWIIGFQLLLTAALTVISHFLVLRTLVFHATPGEVLIKRTLMSVLKHQVLGLGSVLLLEILRVELLSIIITTSSFVVKFEECLWYSSLRWLMLTDHQLFLGFWPIIAWFSCVGMHILSSLVLYRLDSATPIIFNRLKVNFVWCLFL